MPLENSPQLIAGIDVAFAEKGQWTKAAIVVVKYPDLTITETALAVIPTVFPYRSGYLSFREIPAILPAWQQLNCSPDLILCDGQGIAHPRRFGLACHLGVLLNTPSIGVAKSRLIGQHDLLPETKGSWVPVWHQEEQLGYVLRSRTGVKPLYISVGHCITLPEAKTWVMNLLTRYRLPLVTHEADKLSKRPLEVFPRFP